MGRKSKYNVGDVIEGLEIKEIMSGGAGKHVKLLCLCHYCNNEKIISGNVMHRRRSCGCQQRNSELWKSKGSRSMPWQLPKGEAARRNVEYGYKRGAKKRNISYELTTEEFNEIISSECHYCGDKLTNTKKGQGKTSGDFHYTGIDRLDSSEGYTTSNVVACCWKCNNMKHTLSIDEFIEHIRKIYMHTGE